MIIIKRTNKKNNKRIKEEQTKRKNGDYSL